MLPDFNGRSAVLRPVQRPSRNWFPYLVAGALCLSAASAAFAQDSCFASPEDARDYLASEYGELPHAAGPDVFGGVFGLFINPQSRTWTILRVEPGSDRTCMAGAGTDWTTAGDPA